MGPFSLGSGSSELAGAAAMAFALGSFEGGALVCQSQVQVRGFELPIATWCDDSSPLGIRTLNLDPLNDLRRKTSPVLLVFHIFVDQKDFQYFLKNHADISIANPKSSARRRIKENQILLTKPTLGNRGWR